MKKGHIVTKHNYKQFPIHEYNYLVKPRKTNSGVLLGVIVSDGTFVRQYECEQFELDNHTFSVLTIEGLTRGDAYVGLDKLKFADLIDALEDSAFTVCAFKSTHDMLTYAAYLTND